MEILEAWIAKRKTPVDTYCDFCKKEIREGETYIRYFITFVSKGSIGMSPLVVCTDCAREMFGDLVDKASFSEPLFLNEESLEPISKKIREVS